MRGLISSEIFHTLFSELNRKMPEYVRREKAGRKR